MFWATERIDSRTRIPLFIAATISVNEKQPPAGIFAKKLSVRSVSITYGKNQTAATSLPRRFQTGVKTADQPR
jgi:hypothetical protein